jgi:hypothetical protein
MDPVGQPERVPLRFAHRLCDFFLSRKFMLAVWSSIGAFVLAWVHILSGHEWVMTQSLIAGMFKAANVMDKKLGGNG